MSYSQSRQDDFAVLVNPEPGVFLDIGCSDPAFQSNIRLLLEKGWSGGGIDSQNFSAQWARHKSFKFAQGDATNFSFSAILSDKELDYVSLDVDSNSFLALVNLFGQGYRPKCLTVEHDSYRLGDGMKLNERAFLESNGYVAVLKDVSHQRCPYEDWWVREDEPKIDEIKKVVGSWGLT